MKRMLVICAALACTSANAEEQIMDYAPEYAAFLVNNSIVDSCQDSARSILDGYSNAECSLFIYRKRNEALAAKQLQPEDCEDLAFYDGFGAPKFNMRVSLAGGNGQVVKFGGEILDGEDSTIIVYNAQTKSNAIIRYTDATRIFNEVSIGGGVVGYGAVEGSSSVTLASGQQTKIPVIEAFCLQ
ncbi:hypothetical protein [Pseudomonas anguilliseptica]|uniref:hypothetical protein n=1 Tax=Pseudomonas anguilliseptica TaxID=53406 RepID=UPI0022AE693B|nr:hypothetical protein [Pseudomonas anguilliseptica]MCZ4324619.1 hypothetical protein [Pseudomonas anguilliseptica]